MSAIGCKAEVTRLPLASNQTIQTSSCCAMRSGCWKLNLNLNLQGRNGIAALHFYVDFVGIHSNVLGDPREDLLA